MRGIVEVGGDCEDVLVVDDNGADSDITLFITPATSVTSWTVIIEFLSSVQEVSSPLATVTGSGAVWTLINKSYDEIEGGYTRSYVILIK